MDEIFQPSLLRFCVKPSQIQEIIYATIKHYIVQVPKIAVFFFKFLPTLLWRNMYIPL